MDTFNIKYQKAALAYRAKVQGDMCGDLYVNDTRYMCYMVVAPYYRVPQEVWELVFHDFSADITMFRTKITKPYANTLYLGLSTEINWDNIGKINIYNTCSLCKTFVRHDKYIWVFQNSENSQKLCKRCYHEYHSNQELFPDMQISKYVRMLLYVNILDYVPFMQEFPEFPDSNYRSLFYVNCNPQSLYYGSIINREIIENNEYIDYVYDSDQLLNKIHKWLEMTPQEEYYEHQEDFMHDLMLSVNCIQICATFLSRKSKFADKFNALCNTDVPTHRFFLDNRNVWFTPDFADFQDFRSAAALELNTIKDKAVYAAERGLIDTMLYRNHTYRSFTYAQLRFK